MSKTVSEIALKNENPFNNVNDQFKHTGLLLLIVIRVANKWQYLISLISTCVRMFLRRSKEKQFHITHWSNIGQYFKQTIIQKMAGVANTVSES